MAPLPACRRYKAPLTLAQAFAARRDVLRADDTEWQKAATLGGSGSKREITNDAIVKLVDLWQLL